MRFQRAQANNLRGAKWNRQRHPHSGTGTRDPWLVFRQWFIAEIQDQRMKLAVEPRLEGVERPISWPD